MILYLIRYTLEHYVTQLLPAKQVQRVQIRKFNRLLQHAIDQSGFYREVYKDIPPEKHRIQTIEDLKNLPVVTKEDMRKYPLHEIVTKVDIQNLIRRSTSGSTGKPFNTYLTRKEYFTSYFRTFFSLKRYNPFKNFVLIGVFHQKLEIEKKSFLYYAQKYLKLFRREAYSVFTPTKEIIGNIQDKKIHVLSTTPSYLKVLTDELHKQNIRLKVKYVVTFGETLFDDVRHATKQYLQAKIIDVYGCMEHPTLAWSEPDSEKYAYPLNSVILEYVNPISIDGETYGELVITNLVNRTMPFIRYKIGDHVKLLDSEYKKTGKIIGRVEDIITLKNGERIYRQQVWSIFRDFTESKQFRVVQKLNGEVHFQVVPKKGVSKQVITEKIHSVWSRHFTTEPPVIVFLDELPINPKTGKFKNIEVEKK